MTQNPKHPTSTKPRRRRVSYRWAQIISFIFVCLMIFVAVLSVLLKFVILAPTKEESTMPTTANTNAVTVTIITTLHTTMSIPATSTTLITPSIPNTSITPTNSAASTTTGTYVSRATTKKPGMVNKSPHPHPHHLS